MTAKYCVQNMHACVGDCGADRIMKLTVLRRTVLVIIVAGVMGFLQEKIGRSACTAKGPLSITEAFRASGFLQCLQESGARVKGTDQCNSVKIADFSWFGGCPCRLSVEDPLDCPVETVRALVGPSCTSAWSEGCTTSMLEPPERCSRLYKL